ncbi:MAG: hypothetical protein IKT40_07460 [Bacilli bacterium]|nr:hypothetical protein [Bacilli bacterium]
MYLSEIKEYYVYAWYYKDTNEIFYIGKGKNNRYKSKSKRNDYFLNIINKEVDNVDVKFIQKDLNEYDAFELEKQLIKEYKEIGQCKANFHLGGSGGYTGNYDSEDRNKKISEHAKKRIGKLNPMYGKTHSEETRKYLREINLGKKLTEEHKQKLIQANTRRKKTESEIESIRQRMKNKKMTKETYDLMMNNVCPYEYQIIKGDKLIYSCLGHTKLYDFCKNEFGISRTIIDKIKQNNWKPKFAKHMHLNDLKINVINRRVTTKSDECSSVEWKDDTTPSAQQL